MRGDAAAEGCAYIVAVDLGQGRERKGTRGVGTGLLDLTRGLVKHLPVRAMGIVEIAPPLDPSGITLFLALQIVFETFAALAEKRRPIR